jgi:hypothetical protein
MSGSPSDAPEKPKRSRHAQVELSPLIDLLNQQDPAMRSLFATALNLYVSPGADAAPVKEKRDRLKQAIDQSLSGTGASC